MTNPEPKTADDIADAIFVKHFKDELPDGWSPESIIPDIAQAIEEAEKRGAMQLLIAQETVDDIIKESAIAEASVLVGALQKRPHDKTCPGQWGFVDGERNTRSCTCWKAKLPELQPATQAAMVVLEASVEYERRLREFPDDKVLLANAEARWLTAVTEYERVTAGPWQHR